MSTTREELHHLVAQLPETQLRPALQLRGRGSKNMSDRTAVHRVILSRAELDLAKRTEDILKPEPAGEMPR